MRNIFAYIVNTEKLDPESKKKRKEILAQV